MQTKQNRTTHNAGYVTSGNLALVPVEAPRFTVIEGGASQRSRQVAERASERRAVRTGREARMHVRCMVAFVLVLVALVGASLIADGLSAAARERSFEQIGTEAITVVSGDSLWEIAESHPVEGRSVRDVMQWIARTNNLANATLLVGQELIVPAS